VISKMIKIYEYTDFRKFLKDFYDDKKKEAPNFSYRFITLEGGINAGNFSKILKGQRNLSIEAALKLAL
jgi:uncharacterized protein (TIGR02147 family)